jgi:hypothetical protein
LKSVIFQKVLVKTVKTKGISPSVKTIVKFWTRYTLFYPRLFPVRSEVSSNSLVFGKYYRFRYN